MTFDDWFEHEYGPPPFKVSIQSLREEVMLAENDLAIANLKFSTQEHYNNARDAARKAWESGRDRLSGS